MTIETIAQHLELFATAFLVMLAVWLPLYGAVLFGMWLGQCTKRGFARLFRRLP